jgi:hypothetical protein
MDGKGKTFDCSKCNERDKEARGCRGKRKWKVGSQEYYGCPNRLQEEEWIRKAIHLWARWKNYGWPYAGGWAEQPARVFDVIEAVENESLYLDAERMRKARGDN